MAQQLVTPWISTSVTGAYVNTTVIQTASGLASSGVIVLMGEAAGGPSYSQVALKNNHFGPTQSNLVTSTYVSGPIVDAFRALGAPSNDPDITGTASSIYILKTNTGTQASAFVGQYTFTVTSANATAGATYTNNGHTFTVAGTISSGTTLVAYGTGLPSGSGTLTLASGTGDATITFSAFTGGTYGEFFAQNYGVGGNNFKITVTDTQSEVAPQVTGTTVPAFGAALNGDTFTVRQNGGVATVVTLSSVAGNHSTIGGLVIELNGLLPSGIVASAGAAPNTLVFTMSVDPLANASGWGKSFELIDSTPGDLAALGLVPALTTSSQEPAVEVQTTNMSTGFSSTIAVNPDIALTIGYAGTTATVSVSTTTLSTSVTGGSGMNLSIPLAQYSTISGLAAFINTQPGYTAAATPAGTQLPTSALDQVSAVGIAATGAGDMPGRIKDASYEFQTQMGTNTVLSFTPFFFAGLPFPTTGAFLSGGALGGTLAADIVNAIAQLGGIQCNIIVPLFSQDATADILAGNTDPSSTYTIDAINDLLKSHCIQFSTPTLKRNRMAICSFNGTYLATKAQSQSLASYRITLTFQQVSQVNSAGVVTLFLPWYAAVLAGGTQCGGFYKSIDNHYTNAVSYQDPPGFDSTDPSEVEDAVTSGLLLLTQDTGGIRWANDQTTFGIDQSFVYNSVQAVYLSDILALDLAQATQVAIVGKSLADIGASSIMSFIQQRFDYYKKLKITSTSNDAPLGYKNLTVNISAPSVYISLEAKLTTSIIFCAIDLALSSVQQSAA